MDSQQLTVTDTTAMDTRLSTQKTISDGVGLVLALREGERALKEFFKDGVAPTHEIGYILQDHKLDGVKKSLDAVSTSLAALPHMPVQDFDIEPFRKWIQEHREKFDAFGAYCDELVRPESPLEEGEVHPDMERLSYALKTIEHRIDRLAPIVNPQAFELQRRADRLHAAHRQDSLLFSAFMDKFDFTELSEEAQRVAISQHVLKVAHGTFNGLTKQKADIADDSVFWLHPLRQHMARDAAWEEDAAMDFEERSEYDE